jgi:hypothetical protein
MHIRAHSPNREVRGCDHRHIEQQSKAESRTMKRREHLEEEEEEEKGKGGEDFVRTNIYTSLSHKQKYRSKRKVKRLTRRSQE